MKSNSKDLMEALPDFDKILDLIKEIKAISYEKMLTETAIKGKESETFRTVMTDEKLFVNGRPVAVSYFENAYKHGGLGGEILKDRQHLADMVSRLEMKRAELELYKQMHEMYRTLVYSEKVLT